MRVGHSQKHELVVSSFLTTSIVILFLLLDMSVNAFNSTGPPFDLCTVDAYYADLLTAQPDVTSWSKQDLATHVEMTHRNVLPMNADIDNTDIADSTTTAGNNSTNSTTIGNDIYTALIDLYPGDTPGATVNLIYRQASVPATPYGTDLSWDVEHLWPQDHLVGESSNAAPTNAAPAAMTDVHFKAPADSSVLQQKSGLLFGACGTTVVNSGPAATTCIQPATFLTTSDTEQDGTVFLPPASVRGDVARALFYGQLRYANALGLTLSDCESLFNGWNTFGFLSQLLQWHVQDPVSEEEIWRNDGICNSYQGNRNPFIDYPQLVELYFGVPDVIVNGTYTNCVNVNSANITTPNTTTPISNNTTTNTTTTPTVITTTDASCASNPFCDSLLLEGDCCPDWNGTMLDCCFMNVTTTTNSSTMAPSSFTTMAPTSFNSSTSPSSFTTMAPTSFNTVVVLTPASYPTSAPTATMAPSMTGRPQTLMPSISALPSSMPVIITSPLCEDNFACANLTGECCPDSNGTMLDCCSGGVGGDVDPAASDVPSDVPSDMPSSSDLIPTPLTATMTTAPSLSPIVNTTMEPTASPNTSAPSSPEPTASPVETESQGTPVSEEFQGIAMILSGVGNLDEAAITSWTDMTTEFYESVHGNNNDDRHRQTRLRRQLVTEGIENFTTVIKFTNQSVANNRNTLMYSQQVEYVQTSDDAPSALELIEGPFQDESLVQFYTNTLRSSNSAFETLPASGKDAVQLVTPNSTLPPPPPTDPLPTSGATTTAATTFGTRSSLLVIQMGIATFLSLIISTSFSLFS